MTSPRPSSSVCSAWRRLGSFPEISASSHPGLRPPPSSGDLRSAAAAVSSAWAASAGLPAKPGGQEEVWQGVVTGGKVMEGDAGRGREISHPRPAPRRGVQQAQVEKAAPDATEISCWQTLAVVKGEIFFETIL